ncbi:MAG: dTDP-4-dehydrorhamnose reductase [Burkholderiales bacterium RIFCSPLOWO2_02_FULL_57_36]|nr:MAG: dTDP-4-dehydrorhamnose reductase [Burkholderiales bacterium RIFCSPLOWO2_02_FULL_57_36]
MKILLVGKNGQVGYELERSLQGIGEIVSVDRTKMDLANLRQVRDIVQQIKPSLIINSAAYTAVNEAESESELAMCINGDAPGVMAEEAFKLGATMIHYSTDYVFDGAKRGPQGELVAYTEEDVPNPINIYGKTKLAGEKLIVASGCPYLIFRTSWIYGTRGENFLLTMLRLAQENDELSVIADQYGAPTWSRTVSAVTSRILREAFHSKKTTKWWEGISGIYHLTSQGNTTWFGFAQAIMMKAAQLGLLDKQAPSIRPISTKDYSTPVLRPLNSLLNSERLARSFGISCPAWQDSLSKCLLSAGK